MQTASIGVRNGYLVWPVRGGPISPYPSGPEPDLTGVEKYTSLDRDLINTSNGELFFFEPYDPYLGAPMPLYFQRYYSSYLRKNNILSNLGNNWRHNFDFSFDWDDDLAVFVDKTGRVLRFQKEGGKWK